MDTSAPATDVATRQAEPSPRPSESGAGFGLVATGLSDLMCRVTVQVGTGQITVRDCLALTPERLLCLDQTAGEDLRVLANGVLIAAGEVVVDEDRTMIRVTEVAPPNDPGQ